MNLEESAQKKGAHMREELKNRFAIEEEGEGEEILLFLHGFASSKETWQWVKDSFRQKYKLVFLDFAGCGASDHTAYDVKKYATLKGYVEDLLVILKAFDYQNVTIVGHSVGGLIGLLLSKAAEGRVKKVFMIGASPRYKNDIPGYFGGFTEEEIYQVLDLMEENFPGWASYISRAALPESEESAHTAFVEESFRASHPKYTYHFLKVTLLMDHRKELLDVPCETIILQCAKDSLVPMEVAEYMHQKISGSTLHLLSARGHYPHISHPEETAAAILNYL